MLRDALELFAAADERVDAFGGEAFERVSAAMMTTIV
jgi:hypothetical protein